MAFVTLFLCGLAGGVLGGMGMGGGTALIPLLTLFGVEQSVAQGVNLTAFLPMAAVALSVHAGSGLVRGRGLWALILPALAVSALGSLLAAHLPNAALETAFGVFLIVLALFRLRKAVMSPEFSQKIQK